MGKPLPISHEELRHMQKVAESIALGAGKILLNYRGNAQITKSKKDALDIVTEADEASEKYILSEIKKSFPTHGYLSEESGEKKNSLPYRWIIDPLDGTKEFARGLPLFAVNLALEYRDQIIISVVYIPIFEELYSSARRFGASVSGQRIHVSHCDTLERSMFIFHPLRGDLNKQTFLKYWKLIGQISQMVYRTRAWASEVFSLCWIAMGAFEALYIPISYPKWWDIASGILLVEESGGKVTTTKGNVLTEESYKTEGLLASNGKIHNELLKLIV